MALTLVDATQNQESSTDPWIQDIPKAVAVGDIVFVAALIAGGTSKLFGTGFSLNGASTATVGPWTTIINNWATASPPQIEVALGFAIVQTAGDVVVSADMNSTRDGRLVVAILRGAATADIFPVVGVVTRGVGTAPTAASVAPGKAGDWVISVMSHVALASTSTKTSGSINIATFSSTSTFSGNPGFVIEAFEAPDTTPIAGAPTVSTSVSWTALNLVLSMKPEAILGKTISRGLYL
jgi:hypothetical protein